jgi:glycosyltransferase involved in cell wall biosynthesis
VIAASQASHVERKYMKMDIVQLDTFSRTSSDFKSGDSNGASVATNDLTMNLLLDEEIEHVHILNSDERNADRDHRMLDDIVPHALRNRISNCYADDLVGFGATDKSFLGLTSFPGFTAISESLGAASLSIPICSLVHAIPFPSMSSRFLYHHLVSTPADTVIVTSDAGRTAMENVFSQIDEVLRARGFSSSPVSSSRPSMHVVPLGVDAKMLRTVDKHVARDVLELPTDGVYVLYNGRLNPAYKADLEPLIRSVAHIKEKFNNVRLLIAGNAEDKGYETALRLLARECSLADNVEFRLNFPNYLKRYIYGCADIFVSPVDNIQETFGLSIIEAMACGLPVVAPNWSGYRELIADEESGFLVDTWIRPSNIEAINITGAASRNLDGERLMAASTIIDAEQLAERISLLIGSAELRCSMGNKGHQIVTEKYTWNVVMKKFISIWNDQIQIASAMQDRRSFIDLRRTFGCFAQASSVLEDLYAYCPLSTAIELNRLAKTVNKDKSAPDSSICLDYEALVDPFGLRDVLDFDPATGIRLVKLLKRGLLKIERPSNSLSPRSQPADHRV